MIKRKRKWDYKNCFKKKQQFDLHPASRLHSVANCTPTGETRYPAQFTKFTRECRTLWLTNYLLIKQRDNYSVKTLKFCMASHSALTPQLPVLFYANVNLVNFFEIWMVKICHQLPTKVSRLRCNLFTLIFLSIISISGPS